MAFPLKAFDSVSIIVLLCWAGFLSCVAAVHASIREALAVPRGYVAPGGLMLGERMYSCRLIPPRKQPSTQGA